VPELDHVGASAQGGGHDLDHARGLGVRRDHVEPSGLEPPGQLRICRSLSRKAVGAVSQSHECLTTRLRCSWNS